MSRDSTIQNRSEIGGSPARDLALDCLAAGIEAADPRRAVEDTVSRRGTTLRVGDDEYDLGEYDRVLVLGGGNAAAVVARGLEEVIGDAITEGVVVTDNPVETDRIEILPGDHPVPSERGVESTRRLLAAADAATERDLVLVAITGGGSALLPAPAGDVTLADLQATTDELLASGATIHEINAVRKHLSALKGGRLARRIAPATTVGLVVSDVVGDDLSVIASGPLAPDESTYGEALAVVDRYDLDVPERVRERLDRGAEGDRPETPDVSDPAVEAVAVHVMATNLTALDAAAAVARDRGYEPLVLSSRVRGEAREAAKTVVAVAEEIAASGHPIEPPAVVLSGGETTVTIRGDGTGGPNQEFALSAALETAVPAVIASVDTDGIDGATDAAGGIVTERTVADRRRARAALDDNDAYAYLDDRDALVRTGATNTNVNDLRVIVVPDGKGGGES